jgi:integrase/recombinase XerD
MNNWNSYLRDYNVHLLLERGLSKETIYNYLQDVRKFCNYLDKENINIPPEKVEVSNLRGFIVWINQKGLAAGTQARIMQGLRAFFNYLWMEGIVKANVTLLVDTPVLGFRLPVMLNIVEIDRMIKNIDRTSNEGQRNKAIIETLYGCGLRVSELVNLKISELFFNEGYIKVVGKGNKERIVPIGRVAMNDITRYLKFERNQTDIHKGMKDIVFLNCHGSKMSRTMVFIIVQNLAKLAGIKKAVGPHTLRHSFASHLLEGGADLIAIQEMLGHDSIVTTEIYTHVQKQHLMDTIVRFHPRNAKTKNRLHYMTSGA